MTILAIDPGTTRSAWVALDGQHIVAAAIVPNGQLLADLRDGLAVGATVVIEQVASYGMPVGAEVFETVYWSGRFAEAAHPATVGRIPRKAVVTHLCGSARAKDPNVRRVLLDRWGGDAAGRKGGPLADIKADLWAALAVAVTWADKEDPR